MKSGKWNAISFVLCLAVWPVLLSADPEEGLWSGEVDVGMSAKTGNTKSTKLLAKLRLEHDANVWQHRLRFDSLRETHSGDKKAERYLAQFQSNYRLTDRSYLFGVARGEWDEFSGFAYQTSLSGGYGYRAWISDRGSLDLEAGPGVRRSTPDDDAAETELVVRFRSDLNVQISEHSDFRQEVNVITGSENTQTEAITSVTARVIGRLALRLSFTVINNSDVPPDTKKTDTTTAASMVYTF